MILMVPWNFMVACFYCVLYAYGSLTYTVLNPQASEERKTWPIHPGAQQNSAWHTQYSHSKWVKYRIQLYLAEMIVGLLSW